MADEPKTEAEEMAAEPEPTDDEHDSAVASLADKPELPPGPPPPPRAQGVYAPNGPTARRKGNR